MNVDKYNESDPSEERRLALEQLIQRFSVPSSRNTVQSSSPLEDCNMIVRLAKPEDRDQLIDLIADFRVTMGRLEGKVLGKDPAKAERELDTYQIDRYRMYVAVCKDTSLVGYLVCKVEGRSVWADSLFVRPDFRRQRVAWSLYDQAEAVADELGGGTVYNRIHPNNDRIISFLAKRGYSVLNNVEVRRPKKGENVSEYINVGKNRFNYPNWESGPALPVSGDN